MAAMNQQDVDGNHSNSHLMDLYNNDIDNIREVEYPMLKDTIYLDHAGTTLYSKSLIDAFSTDMLSSLFGNPHSASISSQLSARRVEDVRLRALRLFNADPNHFDLVFVANATAGIKLILDGFREEENGFWYGYHRDSHTSLVGVRESAKAGHHCFSCDDEVENWLDDRTNMSLVDYGTAVKLFAYPAQSNLNGRRLPLSWAYQLRSSKSTASAYSLLDAAALVSTSPLDLSNASAAPDFTVLSFYKMFGFPDLGALILRRESAGILRKRRYFGGGTVEMVACGKENWHISKQATLHEQLEDGTLPVHSIIALDNAMTIHNRLYGSFERVASHTSLLADQLFRKLNSLRHANGSIVCQIYQGCSSYNDSKGQGPIVAFNLRSSSGDWVSNAEFEKLANMRNIQVRSGGLCNPGGTTCALNLQPWELKRNFSAGHRCGNENDIIGNKPTGMIRASLGAMSSMKDVETFATFLDEFFVDREASPEIPQSISSNDQRFNVETLTVYPIKSCGGWSIPSDVQWEIREEGLAWDREWCLVHQGTRAALSQKKYPKMALLRPRLDFTHGLLRVGFHGPIPPDTLDEINVPLSADPSVLEPSAHGCFRSHSQVCEDNVFIWTYTSEDIAKFFTDLIGTPCTLARFPASTSGVSQRHTKSHLDVQSVDGSPNIRQRPILLSNESPILTVSRSSLNRLNEQIKMKNGKAAHASVFRANIVVAEDPALSSGWEHPYAEDHWRSFCIGDGVHLDVLGACRRCQMVSVDQHSAEKNEEPFVTLAKTRRKQGKIFFGVHTSLTGKTKQAAMIKVGDMVIPSEIGGVRFEE